MEHKSGSIADYTKVLKMFLADPSSTAVDWHAIDSKGYSLLWLLSEHVGFMRNSTFNTLLSGLIVRGVDPNFGGGRQAPLTAALGCGNYWAVDFLLANGADPVACGTDGKSFLHALLDPISLNYYEQGKKYLKRALRILHGTFEEPDDTRDTALLRALEAGRINSANSAKYHDSRPLNLHLIFAEWWMALAVAPKRLLRQALLQRHFVADKQVLSVHDDNRENLLKVASLSLYATAQHPVTKTRILKWMLTEAQKRLVDSVYTPADRKEILYKKPYYDWRAASRPLPDTIDWRPMLALIWIERPRAPRPALPMPINRFQKLIALCRLRVDHRARLGEAVTLPPELWKHILTYFTMCPSTFWGVF